jgi:hypothetical protein
MGLLEGGVNYGGLLLMMWLNEVGVFRICC